MDLSVFHERTNLSEVLSGVERIKSEIGKIIVGQKQTVELMVVALLADGHVLLEGVPGVAKTLSARLLAKTIDTHFSRIQFTPDLMPSDVLGTNIFNVKTSDFEFRRGPIFSNIVLIDEINRAPAKTQSALFEVMEERQITLDGTSYALGTPFMIIATQNPVEQEGTYRLPEAQLDRFLFKIEVGYPNIDEEVQILSEFHARKGNNSPSALSAVVNPTQLVAYRETVRGLHAEPKMLHYIAAIVQETRRNSDIYLGASPRASVALLTACKALAVIRGRDFITPEDVRLMVLPTLRHRIILTPEKEMEGFTPDDVLKRVLEKVEVPR